MLFWSAIIFVVVLLTWLFAIFFPNFNIPIFEPVLFALVFFIYFSLFLPWVYFLFMFFSRKIVRGNTDKQQEILKKFWIRIVTCVFYIGLPFVFNYLYIHLYLSHEPPMPGALIYWPLGGMPMQLINYCGLRDWHVMLPEWIFVISLSLWTTRNKPFGDVIKAALIFSTLLIFIASLVFEILGYRDPWCHLTV